MANSICVTLNLPSVTVAQVQQLQHSRCEEADDDDAVHTGASSCWKRSCDNMAMGAVDFSYVASQMIPSTVKQAPQVGDLCVQLAPLAARTEEYASIVDLYNTYCAKGSAQMAVRCMRSFARSQSELCIPAIPIHIFVSEWNRSLKRFHDMVRCNREWTNARTGAAPAQAVRTSLLNNVITLTLGDVPARSEHLWYLLHCVISKPSLVKEALQLVGCVSSCSGTLYRTGDVTNSTVPCKNGSSASRLYLIAKSAAGANDTRLGENAGASLGLIWASSEDELFDHFRNARCCHYVHLGTESGNAFRCNGYCAWRTHDREVFERMSELGAEVASMPCVQDSHLAGNTADAVRAACQL
uniref:Uncharacterized protein n=1 Tax=Oryzias latipes TaxID=8090 RepID=A0A286P9U8_ORYLA|nr:hypothetical protein [Oryzias latipes]